MFSSLVIYVSMSPKVMFICGLRWLSACYSGLTILSHIKTIKRVLGIKLVIKIELSREKGFGHRNDLGLIRDGVISLSRIKLVP